MDSQPRPFRACKNKDGSQKFTYLTRTAARRVARNLRREKQHEVHAYKCGECYGYHVGNLPPHLKLEGIFGV